MMIRRAAVDDLAGIFEIYDAEVLRGIGTFDTVCKTAAERHDWLASHAAARYPALVAVEPDHGGTRVLGWATLSPWSTRCAYARAAESSVYVHASARGRGVGRSLMEALLAGAPAQGVAQVLARVVEGNPASLALHERLGFETVGVLRRVGEKFGRVLDVRVMQKGLEGPVFGANC